MQLVLCRISQIFIRPGAQRSHQKRDPLVECCICMEHTSRNVSGGAVGTPKPGTTTKARSSLEEEPAHATLEPTSDDTVTPQECRRQYCLMPLYPRRQIEAALHVEVPPQKRFPAATPQLLPPRAGKPAGYGNSVYSCHPYRRRPSPLLGRQLPRRIARLVRPVGRSSRKAAVLSQSDRFRLSFSKNLEYYVISQLQRHSQESCPGPRFAELAEHARLPYLQT